MRLSILPLVAAVAFSAFGQESTHVEPPVYVTAIDIIADVRDAAGKLPPGLTAEDFIVVEEGVERRVIGLEYLRAATPAATAEATPTPVVSAQPLPTAAPAERAEWQIVLYFETQLSSGASRKRAADALIKQADELVRLGKVDIVFSDPTPTALVRDSRDAEAIRVALRKIIARRGTNKLAAHRRDFYTTVLMGISPEGISTIPVNLVRPYVAEEIDLITRFRTNLIGWLSTYRNHIPRTLLIVTDGFDLDPVEFYAANMIPSEQITLRSYVQQSQLGMLMEPTVQTLAAGGWITVSIPGETNTGNWVDDASVSAVGRVRDPTRVRPRVSARPKSLVYRPLEPLTAMAEATGGAVVPNVSKLDDAIARLGERVKLTYQVARPPDGKARKVEVRSRQKSLRVRTVRWAASSRPDQMAEVRALGLLKGDAPSGDLQIESSVEWDQNPRRKKGMIFLTTKLDPIARILPQAGRGPFRVTFAVHAPPNSAFVLNRLVTDHDPTAASFKYRASIEVPLTAKLIVITVEEINTGLWGSSRVEIR